MRKPSRPRSIPGDVHRSSDDLIGEAADTLQRAKTIGDVRAAKDILDRVIAREPDEKIVQLRTDHRS